ncbi:mandelate racemase/muconate lactonizing enzyme family protein [Acidisphaera sp. S103]|uniref:mandelate racemase/muconate lactonizing enzyme family protein n=1 Tax=Acidisphaera sp. S103 TaxID=1747223 RepID=UPI00131E81D6|nr:mandelate racemase/muconate lactonizing enzyme family protein [Acidisphaera sp. S103]
MKINSVTIDLLKVPLEKPYVAAGKPVDSYWHVLSRVATADGTVGFGYVVVLNDSLVRALVHATRELGQLLIGRQVFEMEATWARLMEVGGRFGPGGMVNFAISSLDMAQWDLAAKTVGQPLYRLLGGYRDRLPSYASDGMWYNLSLDELGNAASNHVTRGFSAVKLRIGHEALPQNEARRVRAVREAVGESTRILVDATETWNVPQAIATGYALQEAGIHWLEDPIDHEDIAGLARLSSVLQVTIATGEHYYLLSEFERLFQESPPGVVIIDLARVGGITPWRHVASMARARNILVCGHVLPEWHVHMLSAIPNGHMVEYVPRSEAILDDMPKLEEGELVAPEQAGIGLSLNEHNVRRFTVAI